MRCLAEFPTRAVAIVLHERLQEIWDVLAPTYMISSLWVLNQEDYLLPSPALVKSVLSQYNQLTIPKISIDEYVNVLKTCSPDLLIFDGSWVFTAQNSPRF